MKVLKRYGNTYDERSGERSGERSEGRESCVNLLEMGGNYVDRTPSFRSVRLHIHILASLGGVRRWPRVRERRGD